MALVTRSCPLSPFPLPQRVPRPTPRGPRFPWAPNIPAGRPAGHSAGRQHRTTACSGCRRLPSARLSSVRRLPSYLTEYRAGEARGVHVGPQGGAQAQGHLDAWNAHGQRGGALCCGAMRYTPCAGRCGPRAAWSRSPPDCLAPLLLLARPWPGRGCWARGDGSVAARRVEPLAMCSTSSLAAAANHGVWCLEGGQPIVQRARRKQMQDPLPRPQ